MMRTRHILHVALSVSLLTPVWLYSQEVADKSGGKPAVIEKLADEKSLDELLDLPEPVPAPTEKTKPGDIPDEEPTEPFSLAVEGMKQAANRMNKSADAGLDTQRIQKQVVARLDRLIADMRRKSQSQQSKSQREKDAGSQQQKGQQQAEGQQEGGTEAATQTRLQGNVQDPQAPDQPLKEQLAEWGNLPPRLRDQLRQGKDDRYSDLYKLLTQQYYRRLAEEAQP